MVNFNFYVVTLTDKVFEYLSFLCTCLLFMRLFQNYIFQDFVIIHQSFFLCGFKRQYLFMSTEQLETLSKNSMYMYTCAFDCNVISSNYLNYM